MKLRTAIASATTAAILATSGVALAGAATDTGGHATVTAPAATAKPAVVTTLPGHHRLARRKAARLARRLRVRRGAAAVITKTIGIDRPTLRTGLTNGETIAQIATDHHVAPQTVIDALVAAADTKIGAAVSAGKLETARAAKLEAKLTDRATKLVNTWHPKRAKKTAA